MENVEMLSKGFSKYNFKHNFFFFLFILNCGPLGQEPEDQVGNLKTQRWERIITLLRSRKTARDWPGRILSQPDHFLPAPETGKEETMGIRARA